MAGAGDCCGCGRGAAVVRLAGAGAGARLGLAVRAGRGVLEITSTVGRAAGRWAEAAVCAPAVSAPPIVVASAIAVDPKNPVIGAQRLLMTPEDPSVP